MVSYHTSSSQVVVAIHLCNRAFFLFNTVINDMKRFYRKVFNSKKPSLGSLHAPGPLTAASTSTSSGTTGLMLSIPSFDSDGTASAQVAAGVSVRV